MAWKQTSDFWEQVFQDDTSRHRAKGDTTIYTKGSGAQLETMQGGTTITKEYTQR